MEASDVWFPYQLAMLYRSYLYEDLPESKSYFEMALREWDTVLSLIKKFGPKTGSCKASFLHRFSWNKRP